MPELHRELKIKEKFLVPHLSCTLRSIGEKGWTYLMFSYNNYDKAVACFKKALELEPEESE